MQFIAMQLQLLLLCLSLATLPPTWASPHPLRRNIIKVRASGFLPFESDLLLPLGILRQLQAQDRASRLLPPQPRRRIKPKPKPKQQVRLEQAHAQDGVQQYNLIDDDGELLLNLRVHTENGASTSTTSSASSKLNSLNTLEEEQETPWRPSRWRPTSRPPLLMTSSSPRPLPLHQYLTSNSLEQQQQHSQTPSTQQRRMFGHRSDWNYK